MTQQADDVFHEGERAVQDRAGERLMADRVGEMIAPRIKTGARTLLSHMPLVAVAAVNGDRICASAWRGRPGFVRSPDDTLVEVVAPQVGPHDPAWPALRRGEPVGLLAIDLATRRRFRVNGTVDALEPTAPSLRVRVREAFPNCPKYIHRPLSGGDAAASTEVPTEGHELDEARRARIARAETAFVASVHRERGLDISHRGGEAGFLQVVSGRTLRIPDYPGNSMFQTLGNFALDPRAALVVLDPVAGRQLVLQGRVTLAFGEDDPDLPSGGTGRYWSLDLAGWLDVPLA